jgi:hypothetical protein
MQPKSSLQKNLQVDWKRWKPEFDDVTNEEDEDMLMPGTLHRLALLHGACGG